MRLALLLVCAMPLMSEPRLLLNRSDIDRIKKTVASEPWAAKVQSELLAEADDWPAAHVREYGLKEWALPKEGAGWSHAYVCPEHGMRLKQQSGKNICPVDGKDYHGWPVDNVVYMQRNGDNARAVRDLGLAWQLTGKAEYAAKARRILNAYSALYPTLPIHDNNNRLDTKSGARIMSQTLSEAGWIVPLLFGYDLVRETMSKEERATFENDVVRNAAAVIVRYQAGKSNWQSWHNAALLAAGLTVKDANLVAKALDGPGGFKFQMRESITPDGPWFEGAWGYHFFAFEPLMLTREMAVRAGIALPEAAALKRMLDAPLRCVFPDGSLPNFSDSGLVRLAGSARHYESGYRAFGDPLYLPLVRTARGGLTSLLSGPANIPEGKAPVLGSELLPSAGMATLRVAGSDHTLAIKFGEHGGGHGHFDKLTFISYANGQMQAADPGTQAYAAKTHSTWDKMTVAHNTVVVDEKCQEPATGRLLEWAPGEAATRIRVSAGPVYPGVEMERTIVHTAKYTLDIYDVRATDGKTHRFDWVYHNYGKLASGLAAQPFASFPQNNGYQHLTDNAATRTGDAWSLSFEQPKSSLRVRMLGAPDTTVVTGNGLGPDLRVPVPFVMARREGTQARFVALYEPYVEKPRIIGFRQTADGRFAVEIDGAVEEIVIAGETKKYSRTANR